MYSKILITGKNSIEFNEALYQAILQTGDARIEVLKCTSLSAVIQFESLRKEPAYFKAAMESGQIVKDESREDQVINGLAGGKLYGSKAAIKDYAQLISKCDALEDDIREIDEAYAERGRIIDEYRALDVRYDLKPVIFPVKVNVPLGHWPKINKVMAELARLRDFYERYKKLNGDT